MKAIMNSIRITLFLMLVLGLAYPLVVTGVAQLAFNEKANGSLIYDGDQLRGSMLIAQNFEKPEYFWPRPSVISFNPLPSGGSNLGTTSAALQQTVQERREKLQAAHTGMGAPPQHLLFASSSGLDPHVSVEAVQYQVQRVALAREQSIEDIQKLVSSHIERRQFGILGEETVNVLALNLALDKMTGSSNK
ncbi:potassium-transporting ATPase subunit KdpC [Pseudobdellovibrio exovorus]|uniref:Potassium-transporting ATPase KdpC subunit n=1 Tax=Pseudobdellovibrio exovorus JSS TaxID=1184267 RepID=M4V678_9BACT|nr:potassium-transporting ATPase subunit KdpC [Pseudobdellovibrio exovorus]AGH94877.1 hypothetical protein A11Q_657 [Pseudobdellovibrio exovorus JSS]